MFCSYHSHCFSKWWLFYDCFVRLCYLILEWLNILPIEPCSPYIPTYFCQCIEFLLYYMNNKRQNSSWNYWNRDLGVIFLEWSRSMKPKVIQIAIVTPPVAPDIVIHHLYIHVHEDFWACSELKEPMLCYTFFNTGPLVRHFNCCAPWLVVFVSELKC